MKELINLSYGLDNVMIASNITYDTELGNFVIENELNDDINNTPLTALYHLDKGKVGKLQREIDSGVYISKYYVCTSNYENQEVYFESPSEAVVLESAGHCNYWNCPVDIDTSIVANQIFPSPRLDFGIRLLNHTAGRCVYTGLYETGFPVFYINSAILYMEGTEIKDENKTNHNPEE